MKLRNADNPSLTSDFSILEMADKITNIKHFQVRAWQLSLQREIITCEIKQIVNDISFVPTTL